jgi:hypothetical protein
VWHDAARPGCGEKDAMSFGIRFDFDLSAVRRMTQRAQRLSPTRQPLRRGFETAAAHYLDDIRGRFLANSKGGGEWPDLAPSTKAARARRMGRRGGAGALSRFPILIETGALLRSLSPGQAGSIQRWLPDGIRVGSGVPYGVYHQHGTGRMPRRQVLHHPRGPTIERMRLTLSSAIEATLRQMRQ